MPRRTVPAAAAAAAALLLAASGLGTAAAACTTDEDCSLNGVCSSGGLCACDPGWVGPSCGALNISTVDPAAGYNHVGDGTSSWGGAALLDEADGLYHLMYAKMEGRGCTLSAWTTNSACWHATAPSPTGPFTDVGPIMGPWCHNPVPVRATDGTWLVYHIGCPGVTPKICSGAEPADAPLGGCGIGSVSILFAPAPAGPWTPLGSVILNGSTAHGAWDAVVSNVAPFMLPNGSVLLAFRGKSAAGAELLGVAAAPHWRGPYARVSPDPIIAQAGEDPWPWVDGRGNVHILFHDFTSFVGGHAYARSWGGPWSYTGVPAYNLSVAWVNGTQGALARRERPQLLRDPATGAPRVLYTGVVAKADAASMASFTMAAVVHSG